MRFWALGVWALAQAEPRSSGAQGRPASALQGQHDAESWGIWGLSQRSPDDLIPGLLPDLVEV